MNENRPLTVEDLQMAAYRLTNQPIKAVTIYVHPDQAIKYEVYSRPESRITVRKPWRLRIRDAWIALRWGKCDEESRREHLSYVLSRIRQKEHRVLTDEARREIEWRIAARRV